MGKEIEVKFRLDDPDGLRRRLRSAARRCRYEFETNRLFDRPDHSLQDADCGLRVREARSLDGQSASAVMLTYKGPRTPGTTKAREEIEIRADQAPALVQILERLGFRENVRFQKRRETWEYRECEITIDELPGLGWFVEIEGPSVQSVDDTRRALDIAEESAVRETYVHLAVTHGTVDADGVRVLLFDSAEESRRD